MRSLIFAAAVLAAGSAVAMSPKAVAMKIFAAADQNGDKALSAEEHKAAGLERYGVTFEEMDLDGNGAVSEAEYAAIFEAHHPPKGQPA